MNIDLIEFHIVEHCNLNCKSCMHFSPLATKSCIKVKDYKTDVKRIAAITKNEVKTIHILGGEPLLHPELLKILKITRQYFPYADIMLISNGILVLEQKPEFWQTLKNQKIHLSITRYPLNINYQQISHLTQKYGIKYTFYAPNKENSQWHFPLDLSGEQDAQYSYDNCRAGNNCTNVNIIKGKLFMCPVVSNARYFNAFFDKTLNVEEDDFLRLKNIQSIDEIKTYLSAPIPFCKYCDINKRTFNNKWEVSKKDISEWT